MSSIDPTSNQAQASISRQRLDILSSDCRPTMLSKSAIVIALLATAVSANSTAEWSTTDQVFTDSAPYYTTTKVFNKTSILTTKNVRTSDTVITTSVPCTTTQRTSDTVITTSAPFTTTRRTVADDSNGTERTSSTSNTVSGTLLQALTASSSSGDPSSSPPPTSSANELPQALPAIAFSIILSVGAGLLVRF